MRKVLFALCRSKFAILGGEVKRKILINLSFQSSPLLERKYMGVLLIAFPYRVLIQIQAFVV